MATHYSVGVLPARPKMPRDKAKVEAASDLLAQTGVRHGYHIEVHDFLYSVVVGWSCARMNWPVIRSPSIKGPATRSPSASSPSAPTRNAFARDIGRAAEHRFFRLTMKNRDGRFGRNALDTSVDELVQHDVAEEDFLFPATSRPRVRQSNGSKARSNGICAAIGRGNNHNGRDETSHGFQPSEPSRPPTAACMQATGSPCARTAVSCAAWHRRRRASSYRSR